MKEYHINYRLDNKETIKQKKREYYLNHKDEIAVTGHNKYLKNKEVGKLKQYNEPYSCECGSVIQRCEKSRHIKTDKHIKFCSQIS